MPSYYTWNDMRYVVYGGAFLAGGGGGGMDAGLAMLQGLQKKHPDYRLELISPEEMEDGQYSAVFGGIGAPSAVNPDTVLEMFDSLLQHGYKVASDIVPHKISAILPPEQGAMTSLMPLLTCIAQGLPLVDADGCDRAVPGLDCCLYTLNGIPFYPGVLTTPQGHVMRVEPKDPMDAETIEKVCRRTLSLFENMMGMVCWYCTKEDILEKLVPGTISKAHAVGKAILQAKEIGCSVEDTIKKTIPLRLLAEGTVIKKTSEMVEGHDIAKTTVQDKNKKRYEILAVNESLVLQDEEHVIMTCPDVICCIDADRYYPMSTADVSEGQHVQYFGTPVSPKWFASEKVTGAFSRHFQKCGYNGYVVRY